MARATVSASDGVTLAVHTYTDIDSRRPTILAIHGYPDNHHVWDGVAEQLEKQHPGRYNVVGYDVRGAGESSAPADKSGYRLPQLIADIGAVIEHLGVDRVHLLGHDWGSVQGWTACTDQTLMPKIASYTSISGPHLQYADKFQRSARTPREVIDVAKQRLASGYIWLFLTPKLPEALFRSGLGGKVVGAFERVGRSSAGAQRRSVPRSAGDYRNGLNLYRANMPWSLRLPPAPLPQTGVAVQVLAPRKDIFVTPALQRFTGSIPTEGRFVPVEGGHWVVTSRPDVIARLTTEWVDRAHDDIRQG
jgi:pimeloyl-ACP methyl ester carboxylesterase